MAYHETFKCDAPCEIDKCEHGSDKLFISNHLAWDFYNKLAGQVIVAGMGEVLGIRFEAIEAILNIYRIEDPQIRVELFEKISIIDGVRMKFKSQELLSKSQQSKNNK